MILNERDSRHEQVLQIAQKMMIAARTAPKAKGVDIIEVAMVTESNLRILSDTMKQMYEENGFKFFLRDADNILEAECVVLIGTREHPQDELRTLRLRYLYGKRGGGSLCHQ